MSCVSRAPCVCVLRIACLSQSHRYELASVLLQAAGPTESAANAKQTKARVRPKSRYAIRLEELDGTAAAGAAAAAAAAASAAGGTGGSSSGGGSGGGGKGKGKGSLAAGMVGGLLVSPAEYKAHMSALMTELEEAWAKEEKVAALKVTVQVP